MNLFEKIIRMIHSIDWEMSRKERNYNIPACNKIKVIAAEKTIKPIKFLNKLRKDQKQPSAKLTLEMAALDVYHTF